MTDSQSTDDDYDISDESSFEFQDDFELVFLQHSMPDTPNADSLLRIVHNLEKQSSCSLPLEEILVEEDESKYEESKHEEDPKPPEQSKSFEKQLSNTHISSNDQGEVQFSEKPILELNLNFLNAPSKSSWRDSPCSICYEAIHRPCFLECGHYYCMGCMEQYTNVHMNAGTIDSLVCPECDEPLSSFDVSCILPSNQYTRYEKARQSLNYIRRGTNGVWCPRVDCSGIAIESEGKFVSCAACNYEFCKKCRCPSHPAKSCKRAKRKFKKKKTERKMDHWARKHTKACPRCNEIIQKNGGCHHMHCPTCEYNFCWICGKCADGPFHCKGRKALAVVGGICLTPVIVVGAAATGVAYVVESRVIHRTREREKCATFNMAQRIGSRLGLGVYWLLD